MTKKKVAIYLHIPFCVQKCYYCDFLSAPAEERTKTLYVEALLRECEYWKERISDYEVTSLFVGGGTPTSLSVGQLQTLQKAVMSLYQPDKTRHVEFTVEMNPGTVDADKLSVLKEMGVNRVSVGLQSADDAELQRLGRIHSFADFLRTVDLLHKASLTNFNVDIMAALPGQNIASYRRTLQAVTAVSPAHISAYSLILEEGTAFFAQAKKGLLDLPDEDTERKMDEITEEYLADCGYHRYEISNYAKNGQECVHNTTYWRMGDYLGLGLGASSYFEGTRFQNETELSVYLQELPQDHSGLRHVVTKKEQMEEFVFLGLRMTSGISLTEYNKRFSTDFRKQYQTVLPMLLENNLLAENENRDRIYLTKRGRDVSNAVLAEFLLEEE
ncbi:oxygen-independent coproporphyrinogen III oxidase [Clostridium sp. OM05-6BH]|uniref:radical SAM family heme chaperone HemW n=1 Tax=unclassified Clostridium TaxID=2614128 RepID=UPI000E50060B|nr:MULTISPECIES: radical SAM family heme chaperone HemW [unclassified Clostridium]RHV16786.1 oxygen-independent coproporphyrinogen III oxidase [Clostridium sp. OM05-9BH]RHV20819.1 oxygen-independent coproporphyrinogen III oxidase [Clostridium sp. OM05-6BH]